MRRLARVLPVLALLGACSVTSEVNQEAFDRDTPRRVAILPFYTPSDDVRELERVRFTRRVFFEQLSPLPFAFLSLLTAQT